VFEDKYNRRKKEKKRLCVVDIPGLNEEIFVQE
jgi:hypothetical protein